MRSKQNLSLLLWLWTSKARKRDGKAPIYLRITIEGEGDTEISTGNWINPSSWDSTNKVSTEDNKEAKLINSELSEILEDLKAHFRLLSKKHDRVTPSMLKNEYVLVPALEVLAPPVEYTLLDAANIWVNDFADKVEEGKGSIYTLRQYRATRNKIKEYAFFLSGKKDIILKKIKHTIADDFYKYLTIQRRKFINDPQNKKSISELDDTSIGPGKISFPKKQLVNLEEAAAKKQLKNIKRILTIATKKGWLEQSPFATDFKCSGGDKEVLPLELFEVESIYRKPISIVRLDEVRDAYIVQCFTGFAFQEIFNLSPDHIIRVGENGERWLCKERGKTKVDEMVPILPIVEEIIEKYKNHPYCLANNRLFPVNSNTKYNGYLKEIGVIVGILRPLKTHLARHTFADIMLNVCNFPLEDVSKMLGHKSIRTTMRYCRIRKNRISENMKNARRILFSDDGKLKAIA